MSRARPRARRRLTESLSNPDVEAIYELLLRTREPTRETIRNAGYTDPQIDLAMDLLHWRELITAEGSTIVVHPPDIAMPAFAANLERQARTVRAHLKAAQRSYEAARTNVTGDGAERIRSLNDMDDITDVAVAVEARISTSMYAVLAGGPRIELVVSGVHRMIPDSVKSPVDRRVVLSSEALGAEDVDADFASRQEVGYDIRTASNLPYNLLIADRAVAIIDTTNADPSGRGSMLVHDPVLVDLLCAWFDLVHRTATPLAAAPEASGLSERDTRIFTLMAAGLTDASIARRLDVSTRTVERRTSWLMGHVEATTRFQAGVKAARAGLI